MPCIILVRVEFFAGSFHVFFKGSHHLWRGRPVLVSEEANDVALDVFQLFYIGFRPAIEHDRSL